MRVTDYETSKKLEELGFTAEHDYCYDAKGEDQTLNQFCTLYFILRIASISPRGIKIELPRMTDISKNLFYIFLIFLQFSL